MNVTIAAPQNAADLQCPEIDPANASIRDRSRLNTFPPVLSLPNGPAGGNGTPLDSAAATPKP
ncbi:MAG: hypothetical protein ACLPT4_13155 [Verrucomicrobiia bacterium]